MMSFALLFLVCVASLTSLASSDGVSDNQPPAWRYLNENGTYVTRDWRKSFTTKIVLSSTKRPDLPPPTPRHIATKPTTTEPITPKREATTIGNVVRRPIPTSTVATATLKHRPNNQARPKDQEGIKTTPAYESTKGPKLMEDSKKNSPNDLALNAAPTIRLSAILVALVSVTLLAFAIC